MRHDLDQKNPVAVSTGSFDSVEFERLLQASEVHQKMASVINSAIAHSTDGMFQTSDAAQTAPLVTLSSSMLEQIAESMYQDPDARKHLDHLFPPKAGLVLLERKLKL